MDIDTQILLLNLVDKKEYVDTFKAESNLEDEELIKNLRFLESSRLIRNLKIKFSKQTKEKSLNAISAVLTDKGQEYLDENVE